MAGHDMGPSTVQGFYQQCRNCGALDTEIQFALGQQCPRAPTTQNPEDVLIQEALDVSPFVEVIQAQTRGQTVAVIQAQWLQGYAQRNLERQFGN